MYTRGGHNMKRKLFTTIALSALLLFGGANSAEAAQTVQVTLPSFDVTLNGQTHSNTYSKYPFLVYKDITYFPMTYYDSRLLGLTTAWSAEEGLAIAKQDGYISEYLRESAPVESPVHAVWIIQRHLSVPVCLPHRILPLPETFRPDGDTEEYRLFLPL